MHVVGEMLLAIAMLTEDKSQWKLQEFLASIILGTPVGEETPEDEEDDGVEVSREDFLATMNKIAAETGNASPIEPDWI